MFAYAFSLLSFLAIFSGGLFAIRFQRFQEAIASLAIGVMLGTVFLEIMPEISPTQAEIYVLAGFMLFYFLQHFAKWHARDEETISQIGHIGVIGIILHSFLDGLAMGIGFLVSVQTGFLIATAILIHGFNDGLTTMTVLIKNEKKHGHLLYWLSANAIAPVLGVTAALLIGGSDQYLSVALALAGGFILYLASSDLLPEIREKSRWSNFALTVGGIILVGLLKDIGSL